MSDARVYAHAGISGPLGDGSAHDAVLAWLDDSKRAIVTEGVNRLHGYTMDKTGRATGHYQGEIQSSDLTQNDVRIHDPLVYGPWLEGTSKRNNSTRFKGYHLWRKTRQLLAEDAPRIVSDKYKLYAERIGGK